MLKFTPVAQPTINAIELDDEPPINDWACGMCNTYPCNCKDSQFIYSAPKKLSIINRFTEKQNIDDKAEEKIDFISTLQYSSKKKRTIDELNKMRIKYSWKMIGFVGTKLIPGTIADYIFYDGTPCYAGDIILERVIRITKEDIKNKIGSLDKMLYIATQTYYTTKLDQLIATRRIQLKRVNAEFKREKETNFHNIIRGSAFRFAIHCINTPLIDETKKIDNANVIDVIASFASFL